MTPQEEKLFPGQDENLNHPSSCQLFLNAATTLSRAPISQAELKQISPNALAYLGDAVYELYVRMFYLLPPCSSNSYHHAVVAQVRAEMQALHLQSLIPHLLASELEIVRRGRNAAMGKPKRIEAQIYQQATSLETLIGYLYLTDENRLIELLRKLNLEQR